MLSICQVEHMCCKYIYTSSGNSPDSAMFGRIIIAKDTAKFKCRLLLSCSNQQTGKKLLNADACRLACYKPSNWQKISLAIHDTSSEERVL